MTSGAAVATTAMDASSRWAEEAHVRLDNAETAFLSARWLVAIESYGISVEMLLKAVILKRNRTAVLPTHITNGRQGHDLAFLASMAGLDSDIAAFGGPLKLNWVTAKDWKIAARYPDSGFGEREAKNFRLTIGNKNNGVFWWIREVYYQS